jgi:hypothetical protein
MKDIFIVLSCIGFFCVGYSFGYTIGFEKNLKHLSEVFDDLIAENERLRQ